VILNRVASARHERLARLGMEAAGITVLGALPRRGDLVLPERHLGLVQAAEHPDLETAIVAYAAFLRAHVDLPAIRAAVRGTTAGRPGALPRPPAQRIALAQDAAFSFAYPHLVAGWRAGGAEILPFSPLADEAPTRPPTSAGCPAATRSCTQAALPPPTASAARCAALPKPGPCMANAGATWPWATG
jgi:cobyrinic acid a,c-diamide synthase